MLKLPRYCISDTIYWQLLFRLYFSPMKFWSPMSVIIIIIIIITILHWNPTLLTCFCMDLCAFIEWLRSEHAKQHFQMVIPSSSSYIAINLVFNCQALVDEANYPPPSLHIMMQFNIASFLWKLCTLCWNKMLARVNPHPTDEVQTSKLCRMGRQGV